MAISTTIRPIRDDNLYEGLIEYLDLVKKTKCKDINFNFKYLEKIDGDEQNWDKYALLVKKHCEKLGFNIPVTHAFYTSRFVFNSDNEKIKTQDKKIKKCIRLSKLFGANTMVVHSGIYVDEINGYDEKRTIEENVKYFLPLCRMAKDNNIKVAIENNVVHNNSKRGAIVEPSVTLLNRVCDAVNEVIGENVMGLCYDIGHANLVKRDILKDINDVKKNLFAFHLHNNYGYDPKKNVWRSDKHYSLLNGNIDIGKVIELLKKIKYDKELVIESVYYMPNEEIISTIDKDISFVNNLINKNNITK